MIYALKGIKGWKFLNPKEDIINLLKQFIRIAEKIEEKYDTIITVPSSNELNTKFLYRLNKIIKAEYKISDYFGKMYSEDVLFDYINWEQMRLDLGGGFDKAKKELEQCFFKMEIENNGIFSFKYIKDVGLRKYIQNSMNADIEKTFEIAPFVDGKNILILDDTISSGASISEACKLIVDTFTPNSVTVVTLFSKL